MALLLAIGLSACVGGGSSSSGRADGPALAAAQTDAHSAIIADLLSRQSFLPGGGPYSEVARAVTEANAAPARAELRVARLRAEAKSKNWLPRIKPSISLTDMGETFASLLLEQVLFDNGARKAERAYAAADVEVAATSLSQDFNERVFEGLSLYVRAQRALDQARIADTSVTRMADFERIVGIRVEGGMSDSSERRVITQKTSEMRAEANDSRFQAQQAMAELNVLAARDLSGLSGLQSLPADPGAPEPLAIVKARAEGARTTAEATALKAGYLPGLKATANLDQDGDIASGLTVDLQNSLGLGTGQEIDALNMTGDLVDRRIAKTADEANRAIVALQYEITTLAARQAEGAGVLAQTASTVEMFTEQFKMGRRTLMELVNMFESYADMQRIQASLKYEIALKQLQIARNRGVLVNGGSL